MSEKSNELTEKSENYLRTIEEKNRELEISNQLLKQEIDLRKKHEAELRTILDNIPVGIWTTDETGIINYGNKVGQDIWQGARYVGIDEFTEYKGWFLDTGKEIAPEEWAVARVIRNAESILNEKLKIRCFDGTYKTIINSAVPVFDENRKLLGAVIVNQDITDLRLKEEKLAYQAMLLENVNDAIIALDKDLRVTYWNRTAEKIYGWREEEALGQILATLVRPQHDKTVQDAALFEIRSMGNLYIESVHRHKNGSEVNIGSSSMILKNDQGEFSGIVVVNRDITELKAAEKELRHTLNELQRSNRELEQFAYIASHDLQEPLRMVLCYSDLLSKRYESSADGKITDYISFITSSARRMSLLIKGLLEYGRISSPEKKFETANCNDIIKNVLDDLKLPIEESSASIELDDLPELLADPLQIRQLFQNLLSNSLKFRSTENLRIEIKSVKKDNHWLFIFSDNGIGIDPEFHDKIFLIFQQLHERGRYAGTGIGLALCKKIIENHGGKIWVESQTGKGSTFYFSLPLKQ